MEKKITFWFFLLSLSVGYLAAQCPFKEEIEEVISTPEVDVEKLELALWEAENCQLSDTLLGNSYHRLGIEHYLNQNLEKAILFTQKGLFYRKKYLSGPELNLGKSNHNLGVFYKELGQYSRAIPHFRKAAEIYEAIHSERATDSRRELASIYSELRDFGPAIIHINRAIENARKTKEEQALAQCFLEYGKILFYHKKYRKALDYLHKAEVIFNEIHDLYHLNAIIDEAACYNNLGLIHDELKNYPLSLRYYQNSFEVGKKFERLDIMIQAMNNMGIAYKKMGLFAKAESTLKNAMELLAETPGHYLTAYCLDNLGDIQLEQKKFDSAINYYQQAIAILVPGYNPQGITDNPDLKLIANISRKSELVTCLLDQAEAWEQYGEKVQKRSYLDHALEKYQLADKVLDFMRLEQQSPTSKFFWREEAHNLYERSLDLCFQLMDYTSAFYFFEKSKSVLLLDAFIADDARQLLPEKIALREENLQREIQIAINQLDQLNHSGTTEEKSIQEAKKNIEELQYQYDTLLQQLEQEHPNYYQFRYATKVISLPECQKLITSNGAQFIHYFAGKKNYYLLRIAGKDVQFEQLPRSTESDTMINELVGFFQKGSAITDLPSKYGTLAFSVFQAIYKPVWNNGSALAPRVLICPDGLISNIPFEALLTDSPGDQMIGQYPYLIKKQQISYCYSGTVLAYQEKVMSQRQHNQKILFIAPFTRSSSEELYLPHSQEMLDWLRSKIPGLYLTGEEGNGDNIFNKQKGSYGIIHFSTHAKGGNEQVQPHIQIGDTILFLGDLNIIAPSAPLVILSACETGVGVFRKGEGIINLAKGFAYSGAGGMITSLWKVNDRATYEVLKRFYEHLLEGTTTSQALHQAKLDYLQQEGVRDAMRSPYLWSGLVYWGVEMPPPIAGKVTYAWIISVLIVLLGLIGLYWRNRSIQKKQKKSD